jgi:ABC-type nitrate/sulfonate/bicarbonate transport system substrate-binding protein
MLLALAARPGATIAADKVVLQLHREPQFEFAGYYTALWKGFYREAGLEVEIKPGAALADPVREVAERRAQFGTGTAQLLIRANQGLPLLLLAPIFQQSGMAVYYRADRDFSSVSALLNAKLARPPAGNVLDLELRSRLHAEGIDPEKLRSVPIEPDKAMAALADRRVEAVVGSAWELPWQARERGVALKSLTFDHSPAEFYGDSLFTSQRFANSDPEAAQRFRQASIKGWDYALRHPDEIAARIVAELPIKVPVSDAAGFARYQSEIARRLARFPEVAIGQSDTARWSANQQSLAAIAAISRPADLAAFLYDPGAEARRIIERQILLIIVAAIGAALLGAAGLSWRRHGAVPTAALSFAAIRKRLTRLRDLIRPLSLLRPVLARRRAAVLEALGRVWNLARLRAFSALGIRPDTRPTDLNATLSGLEDSLRQRLPGDVECRFSLLPEPWLCRADPGAASRLVLELAGEAVADLPAGGELVVGTRQFTISEPGAAEFPGAVAGDYVRLTVKDNGSGLPPEQLERVFFRTATVRPAAATAWELMRRLGGFASVESAQGLGTAVHLYFRRMPASSERREPAALEDVQALAAE